MDIHDPKVVQELKRRYTEDDIKSLSSLYFTKTSRSMPRVDFYNAYWRAVVHGEKVDFYKNHFYLTEKSEEEFYVEYSKPDVLYFLKYTDNQTANYAEWCINLGHDGVFKDIISMLLKPLEDIPLCLNYQTHKGKIAQWRLKIGK